VYGAVLDRDVQNDGARKPVLISEATEGCRKKLSAIRTCREQAHLLAKGLAINAMDSTQPIYAAVDIAVQYFARQGESRQSVKYESPSLL
jgi:hypothetical protein